MSFKMYGQYKYDLELDLYVDEEGNTLDIRCDKTKRRWLAKFSKNNEEMIASSFEELDVLIENYIYSKKSNIEKIETFPKPPVISQDTINIALELANI